MVPDSRLFPSLKTTTLGSRAMAGSVPDSEFRLCTMYPAAQILLAAESTLSSINFDPSSPDHQHKFKNDLQKKD